MDRDAARRAGMPPDVHEDDEIEILEVVGLDDSEEAASDEEEGDEIVLDFPEDHDLVEDRPSGPTRAAPTVALERFVRLQADFENLRKRTDRERDEQHRYAAASLVERLLPVLDNLERALAAPVTGSSESALRQGLAMIHRQFLDELTAAGLRPVKAVGEIFDPLVHEAVETEEGGDREPNTVVSELLRGYWFHDRVLRPALVRVAVTPAGGEFSDSRAEEE